MRRLSIPVFCIALAVAGLSVRPAVASPTTDSIEVKLLQLINQGRATNVSKPAEVMHAGLRSKARGHSAYQASINALTHDGLDDRINTATPDPAEANGPPDDGFVAGQRCENVAYYFPGSAGATPDQVAQWFYDAWFNSSGHRNCMFDVWNIGLNAAGVGIHFASNGYYWATLESQLDNTPPAAQPPPATWNHVEENGAGVTLTGTWTSALSSSAYGGGYRYSRTAGNKAVFTFNGTAVRWFGAKGAGGGIASLKLDGVSAGSVDMYSAATVWKANLFERTGLSNAQHTLEITVTGNKNPAASFASVYVDAFEYQGAAGSGTWTRIEQTGSGTSYTGTAWVTSSSSSASGGSYRYSRTANNIARFAFTGTGVRWIAASGTGGGIANVRLDGVQVAQVNLYSSSTVWKKIAFERTGLSNSAHTLEVIVTGTKSAAAVYPSVYVDAFDYFH